MNFYADVEIVIDELSPAIGIRGAREAHPLQSFQVATCR